MNIWPYRILLGSLLAGTLVGVLGALLSEHATTRVLADNVHWTCSFAAGALLASRAMDRARTPLEHRAAMYWTWGMVLLTIGQLIWAAQVYFEWLPFPGPSDYFFIGTGIMLALGYWGIGQARLRESDWRTVQLDTLACVTATLAASMAFFLPRQGSQPLFQTVMLAAYPLAFVTPACLGLITALTARAKFDWRAFMLPGAIALFALHWVIWNLRLVELRLIDGNWLNIGFSVLALCIGAAVKGFRLDVASDASVDRRYEAVLRMLPLSLVVLSAIGLIYTMGASDIPPSTLRSVQIGSIAVVLMAFARQILLLRERDRLIIAERLLRQRECELELRVSERTHELAMAMREAQAASHAKSEFLANVSHEIRTPLNGVLGFAQLAMMQAHDETQRSHLANIQLAGKQLLRLINDILDMSRIEAGKLSLEHIPFELATVLKSVETQLGQQARDKGLSLHITASPRASRRLMGDPLRIEQIVLNYLSNAIKFTQHGSVSLDVDVTEESPTSTSLRIEVKDTGPGLARDTLTRLFSNFEQADKSTTRRFGGSGLGLSICRRLADLMGGTVGAESEPGEGSCFWLELTLDKAEPAAPRLASQMSQPAADHPQPLQGTRVLLAEDNEVNQLLAIGILEHAGAVVRVARNGREAIDMLRSEPFDCVLMDVHMPEMDGLEATRQIRADPRLSHMHVIAMTANARQEDQSRCREAGMDDVICKPYDAREMCATVSKWAHWLAA